jgi:membrane-associated phospholipid phosphatase
MRLLIYLFCIFSFLSTFGQSDSSFKKEKLPQRVYSDVFHVGKSILYVYKRPFSWKKKEWITFGATLGAAAAISFLDENINDYFKRNKTHFQDQIADIGDAGGQPEYQGPSLLAFWAIGVSIDNKWMRETGSMLAASMAASGLIQTFSKDAVGRARPSKGDGNLRFKPFGGKNYHSFPSGHTMLAISSSWILARQIKPLALKIPFYAMPVIVGWSRIYDNAHWSSDILLGSVLGIATAEAVIKYYSKIKKDNTQTGLTILPTGNGISLAYRF